MTENIRELLKQDDEQLKLVLSRFPGTFSTMYAIKVMPDIVVEKVEEEKIKTGTDEDGLDTYEIKEKIVTEPSRHKRGVILKAPVCHTWINGKGEKIDEELLPEVGDIVVYDKFQGKPFEHLKDVDLVSPFSLICWYNQRDPANKFDEEK